MDKLIKVCGMTDAENIRKVEELGVNMIGFIFYPKSPRCLCSKPEYLPSRAKRVGVFVNESRENVQMYADRFSLDYIQLHGNESPEYCRSLQNCGLHLIKAFPVCTFRDLYPLSCYDGLCDYFLFDTKTPDYGGSGTAFNWNILHRYNGTTPFLLSGGIGPESVSALKAFQHPYFAGIDLNSRFETAPGIKDTARLETFLRAWKE